MLIAMMVLVITAAALAEDREVKASDAPGLQVLSSVFEVHTLSDSKSGASVRLFESGGGDPAMNGNRLMLSIVTYPDQEPRVWETGIDVYTVKNVDLNAEKSEIVIEVAEHSQGDDGRIGERPATYTLRYQVDPETAAISKTLRVHTK
jgi:hypothetical protein